MSWPQFITISIAPGETSRILWERPMAFLVKKVRIESDDLDALLVVSVLADLQEQLAVTAIPASLFTEKEARLHLVPSSVYRWRVTIKNTSTKEVELTAKMRHAELPRNISQENRLILRKAAAAKRKLKRERKFPPGFGEEK